MHSDGGLNIERIDGELIVRSRRTTINWLGVLFTGFSLYWAMTWNGHDARDELTYWLGLALGIAFIAVGIALLLPRSIVTIFDLRSQSVCRSMNIFGWTYRDHTYPFADIAGIGIVEGSDTDNRDPLPVLVLKAGPTLPLDTVRTYRVDVGELESAKAIEAICAATGLQKCNNLSQMRRGQKAVRGEDEAKNQTSPVSWSRIVITRTPCQRSHVSFRPHRTCLPYWLGLLSATALNRYAIVAAAGLSVSTLTRIEIVDSGAPTWRRKLEGISFCSAITIAQRTRHDEIHR